MTRKTKKKLLTATIATSAIGFLYALFFEKYFFEVKMWRIGKMGSDQHIRLLFLTDLHFKKFLDPSYKKLARTINAINSDLILIAGDLIDEDGFYAPAKEFFSLVNYSIPKVAILGNHDHKNRVKMKSYRVLFEQNNCRLLMNESLPFDAAGTRLMVTGVDDFINGHACFAKAVANVGKDTNHVLLIHSPLQQETILREIVEINNRRSDENKLNIQYIFAGHNHGGQVCLFGFALKMPDFAGNYLKGWYNNRPPYLYLSKGFGTSTLPFRFGARSEITLFYWGV